MEWVAEGLTLCFIGALVLTVTLRAEASDPVSIMVYRAAATMLLVMAAWTGLTGARTSIIPIKICPSSRRRSPSCLSGRACCPARQGAKDRLFARVNSYPSLPDWSA